MNGKIKLICVVGPTAGGKTALGVKIAKAVGGEIISADSMQIYKDMHIASAAVDPEEMGGIPHHLIEFLPYGSRLTVYDYLVLAREKIAEINSRGHVPVIVGGTGLYINAIVDNICLSDAKSDENVRRDIENEFDAIGGEKMLERLSLIDPETSKNLHANDRRRIVRAFEIYKTTGITKTEQDRLSLKGESPYNPVLIGLTYSDRQKLYDRINLRVDLMLEAGLLDEARAAYQKRGDTTQGAVQAIGHKEFFSYFEGSTTLDEAVEKLKRQTRRYAKRQLTWFGARDDINWLYPDVEDVEKKAMEILKREGFATNEQ